MDKYQFNKVKERLTYFLDCSLATVEYMCLLSRINKIVRDFNGSVEEWANSNRKNWLIKKAQQN